MSISRLLALSSVVAPIAIACSASAQPESPSAPAAPAVETSSAAISCEALPYTFGGQQWMAQKGARPVFWWNGTACDETAEPFGLSGVPLRCEGPGCRALFDTADACAAAHAQCDE